MGKKHIMGSKPGQDPMEQMERSGLSVTTDSGIKWENRKLQNSWTIPSIITLVSFIGVFMAPLAVIILTIIFIPTLLVMRYINSTKRLEQEGLWQQVNLAKTDLESLKRHKAARVKEVTPYHVTGMNLKMIGVKPGGSLSSVIRGVREDHGFFLNVSMSLADPKEVVESDNLHKMIQMFLKTKSASGQQTYMDFHGELWKTNVNVMGTMYEVSDARPFRNSIRGAIPSKDWKDRRTDSVISTIDTLKALDSTPGYYLVGSELSEWLVELSSMLSGEVGISIPSQFVADIRSRPTDYIIGRVLNPDTLRIGPATGLASEDIEKGLLVCGGTRDDRWGVLGQLARSLIQDGKRVLFISSHLDSLRLTGLHDASVGLTLGRDLVLNPVDAEEVPRSTYVTQLLTALEVFTEAPLTSTPDLELALGKAVALSGSTVADVKMEQDEVLENRGMETFYDRGNKHALLGMDAIRRLHQGGGAKAFYGTQTIPLKRLTEQPLSVTAISLEDNTLDNFGWDLMLMKLGGIKNDKDVVVILDDPASLRFMFKRYARRETWIERLMKKLSEKFSLIVSIDRPSDMGGGIKNLLDSCISFRLKTEDDIATVSSSLALSVIGSGMHSKARWSPRESSFLRTMEDGTALIVHNATETAQPVKLNPSPLPEKAQGEELRARLSELAPLVTSSEEKSSRTFIESVGGSETDLTHRILRLLERYEPLTEEAVRKFIQASGAEDIDVEGVIIRLREAGMVLEGHENHSGIAYKNYRLTMKGQMALRQSAVVEGTA